MPNKFRKILMISLRANWFICLLVLGFFGLGSALGGIAVERLPPEQVDKITTFIQSYLQQVTNNAPLVNGALKISLINNVGFILVIYLLGLTIIGVPVVLVLLIFKGFYLGFAIGFFVKKQIWPEVIVTIASIVPQNILFIPGMLIGSIISISFSAFLVKKHFNTKMPLLPSFLGYSIIMLGVITLVVASSFVEVYGTPLMIKTSMSLLGR